MNLSERINKKKINKNATALWKNAQAPEPAPSIDSPLDRIMHLQRTLGNQVVQRLIKSGVIRTKLKIGETNAIDEQGVARVADEVIKTEVGGRSPEVRGETSGIQTKGKKAPSCSDVKIFTELDMPYPIDNYFFEENTWFDQDAWEKKLEAAAKGKCKVERDFDGINLSWDFKNPNIGTFYGKDLNKGSVEIDIEPTFVYAGNPCCACFAGTVSWDFTVTIKRNKGTKSGKPESGTQTGIKGSQSAGECKGDICCSVNKNYTVSLGLASDKDALPELEAYFSGKISYSGNIVKED